MPFDTTTEYRMLTQSRDVSFATHHNLHTITYRTVVQQETMQEMNLPQHNLLRKRNFFRKKKRLREDQAILSLVILSRWARHTWQFRRAHFLG